MLNTKRSTESPVITTLLLNVFVPVNVCVAAKVATVESIFNVTAPEVPPPVKPVPAVTAVISPTTTPATAVSTYSLFAASVFADTVSIPCILPVPLNIILPAKVEVDPLNVKTTPEELSNFRAPLALPK